MRFIVNLAAVGVIFVWIGIALALGLWMMDSLYEHQWGFAALAALLLASLLALIETAQEGE